MLAELTAEADTIKDELKAEMTAQDVEEMTVDVFKLRYKTVISKRLDSKALKTECAELYNRFCKETSSKRFSIA